VYAQNCSPPTPKSRNKIEGLDYRQTGIYNELLPAALALAHLFRAAAAIFALATALIFRLALVGFMGGFALVFAHLALCAAAIANLPASLILRLIFRTPVVISEDSRVAESSLFNSSILSTRSAAFLNWCDASDNKFIM
jgi:hypothetical protein